MRNTPYYKKDGISYAKSVMTQNRLPKTASMAEVINTAKSRVTKHLGTSKYIPTSKDMLEKIDLKTNQAMMGDNVDLNALVATHVQRDYQNGLKFIDKFNQSRRSQLQDIETIFKNNLDDAESALLDTNQSKVEALESRLQSLKDKVEKLGIESNIDPNIKPSVFEIEAEFYKTEFQDLKKLSRQLKNAEKTIYDFKDIEPPKYRGYEAEEFYNIFKGKKLSKDITKPLWKSLEIDPNGEIARDLKALDITPKNAIGLFKNGGLKSADNLIVSEYTDYNLKDDGAGYSDRDSLIEAIADSFNNKSFDKTRDEFIKESGLDPKTASKQDFLNYFKNEKPTSLKQELRNVLKQKKQEYDTLKNEYDSRSNDLKRHAIEVQNTAERIYKESIQNQLDVLSKPVYNKQAIDSLEQITQEIDDYKIDDELVFLETALSDYENSGLLDADDLKAIEYVNRFNKEDFENMKQQATTCLLTGGANEA